MCYVFGLLSREGLETMSRAILASDVPRLLQQQKWTKPVRICHGANELIEYFRDLLVVSHGEEAASVLNY